MKKVILLFIFLLTVFGLLFFVIDKTRTRFSFVVLPDTQFYSEKFPEVFMAQTRWIANNMNEENIKAVITLGDIVQNDDEDEDEWKVADNAYRILDLAEIPYSILPGNHDITETGATKLFNKYFPEERYRDKPWYKGNHDGTNRNNYIIVSPEGVDFIIVSMEYCPPDAAVAWASQIFEENSNKIGILATHAFLDENGNQAKECNRNHKVGDNTGEDLWDKIVVPNENIQIILNGHFHHEQGGVYRTMKVGNRTVHQMMSNYQDFPNGGNGFLRILEFEVSGKKVKVTSYSPYLDEYLIDTASKFSFILDKL